MPWAALGPILGSVGGGIVGALFGGPKTTTTTPVFTQGQQQVQQTLKDSLLSAGDNPAAAIDPLKSAALESNNRNYENLTKRLQASASSRGFGRSGMALGNEMGLEVSRAGSAADINSKFAATQLDYENSLRQQMQQFGFADPGQTTTGPDTSLASGLSGGLSTLTTMLTLNKLLKGSGSPGGQPQNMQMPDGYTGYGLSLIHI